MSDFDKVEYWLAGAEYDLETARAMLATGRMLYVGFMCHQTIEKALKAVFVRRHADEMPPFIHQLTRLADSAGISEDLSEEQERLLAVLNPLSIEARYPSERDALFASLTKERCQQILRETEAMLAWIKARL